MFFRFYFLLILTSSAWAAPEKTPEWFAGKYRQFIELEHSNSYVSADTEVGEAYQPKSLAFFKLPFILVPEKRLITEVSTIDEKLLKEHFYIKKNGQRWIRFFIHPESIDLYKPLIDEFGIAGHYDAIATSSTRTVLAANTNTKNAKPVFIKLSLAKLQDKLGRIVPSWEIRRSIRNTEQLLASKEIETANNVNSEVSLIPEVAGAHLRVDEGLSYYVDKDQQQVFDHGYILRDASFLEINSEDTLVPMFWLYSSIDGNEPPIISYWKKARKKNSDLKFKDYYREAVVKPFVEYNLELMIRHGVFPQFHSQNVLLRIDTKDFKINSIIHRDLGSFKTDLKLRWIHGLDTEQYRSSLADKDFGLSWGSGKFWEYFENYFYKLNYLSYMTEFKKWIPSLRPRDIHNGVFSEVFDQLSNFLKLGIRSNDPSIMLHMWMEHAVPDSIGKLKISEPDQHKVSQWIRSRNSKLQEIPLPKEWQSQFMHEMDGKDFLFTRYGLLRKQKENGEFKFSLVLYDKKSQKKIFPTCSGYLSSRAN